MVDREPPLYRGAMHYHDAAMHYHYAAMYYHYAAMHYHYALFTQSDGGATQHPAWPLCIITGRS